MARRDWFQPQRSPRALLAGQPPARRRPVLRLTLGLAGLALALCGPQARAQSPSPNQPLAIDGMEPPPCRLLVPRSQAVLQPLRIQPSQVAGKNAMGCLSPADASVYGADGCPRKLCQAPQGTVPVQLR